VMTASWLRQMGFGDVFVRAEAGSETGTPATPLLGPGPRPKHAIDPAQLADMLAREEPTVVDLSLSRNYLKGHIPGAWFAIRSRLAKALPKIGARGTLVLTSEDGIVAGLAAPEAAALTDGLVHYLADGNAAWQAAGHALSDAPRMADDPVDVWLKPYERAGDVAGAMQEYLSWEVDLLQRIARDGTTNFRQFPT
jgi:hypothetical protein